MSWFRGEVIKRLILSRPSIELVEPTAEEVRGWLGMGVGKYHKAQLIEKLEDLKENWANGDYTGSTTEETIQLNSEALGKVQAYADIILTLEEMTEDEETED
jgi:hypothetical protein